MEVAPVRPGQTGSALGQVRRPVAVERAWLEEQAVLGAGERHVRGHVEPTPLHQLAGHDRSARVVATVLPHGHRHTLGRCPAPPASALLPWEHWGSGRDAPAPAGRCRGPRCRRNQLACWAKHPRNTSSLGFALQGRHGPRPDGEGSTVDDDGCQHMRAGLRGARGPCVPSTAVRAVPTRSSRPRRHAPPVHTTAPSPRRGLFYGGTNEPTSGIPSGLGVATRYRVIVTAPTLTSPYPAIDGGTGATELMGVPSEHHHSGPRAGHSHHGAGTFPVRRRKEVFQ